MAVPQAGAAFHLFVALMAEGVHGGGLWSCAMTNARVHGIHDWLSKAPSGTQEPYRQPLSRHWQGADLNKPKPYYGQGRRETDVREACHWRTARAPDAGQLMLRRAPRGAHRAIHGGTDAEMLPAEAVIYSGPSIPRGSPPPPLPPPPEREGGPCFYMGEMLSERPVNGGIWITTSSRGGSSLLGGLSSLNGLKPRDLFAQLQLLRSQ